MVRGLPRECSVGSGLEFEQLEVHQGEAAVDVGRPEVDADVLKD